MCIVGVSFPAESGQGRGKDSLGFRTGWAAAFLGPEPPSEAGLGLRLVDLTVALKEVIRGHLGSRKCTQRCERSCSPLLVRNAATGRAQAEKLG